MNKTAISIIFVSILVAGTILLLNKDEEASFTEGENVIMENGKQIIQIDARGGYNPKRSYAKSGVPTIVRFNTQNTFDCSSVVNIPSLGIKKSLTQTGSTDIEIGSHGVQTLQGTCGMGMYHFEVIFEN